MCVRHFEVSNESAAQKTISVELLCRGLLIETSLETDYCKFVPVSFLQHFSIRILSTDSLPDPCWLFVSQVAPRRPPTFSSLLSIHRGLRPRILFCSLLKGRSTRVLPDPNGWRELSPARKWKRNLALQPDPGGPRSLNWFPSRKMMSYWWKLN